MNFRITTKNYVADSKIGSTQKIDFRPVETHESHPTAWELSFEIMCLNSKQKFELFPGVKNIPNGFSHGGKFRSNFE